MAAIFTNRAAIVSLESNRLVDFAELHEARDALDQRQTRVLLLLNLTFPDSAWARDGHSCVRSSPVDSRTHFK